MPKFRILILLSLIPVPALAQTPSQRDLIPPRPTLPQPSPQDKPPIDIPVEPPPLPPDLTLPDSTVTITQFKFTGNTVFDDEQIEAVISDFLNKELTFTELQKVKQRITGFYQEQGYITSGAIIPVASNQRLDPQNATITIAIIEGKLEEIQISGADRLDSYIRSRLKHREQDVFNRETLLEALRLLQVDPLFKSVSAEVQPGTRPDQIILKIMATANNPFDIALGLNNYRSPAVGSFQRKADISYGNVLGLGDRINVGYANTNGSNAFSGQYTLPVGANNSTLQISYDYFDSKIVEEPFNQIDIEGDSSILQVAYRHPLFRRASETSVEEFALGVSASRYESENSILGIPFPLSEGADALGRTEVTAIRFFQDWSKSSRQQAIAFRSQFSFGLDVFSPTLNPTAPDGRFFAWQFQGQYFRNLTHGLQFIARGLFNIADRPLLAIEQTSIGGFDSVRGYRQNALLRDNGVLASVELSIPIFTRQDHALRLMPFIDFGTGWNYERANPVPGAAMSTDTLLSTGLGLSYRFKNNLSARLNWGIPLLSLASQGNSLQEDGFTFSLQWTN